MKWIWGIKMTDDLGIIYKDDSQTTSKPEPKKSSKDDLSDLGIKFKDENDTASESFGTEALNAINQAGGTVAHGIADIASDIPNTLISGANYANQKVAGLFGVKPENVPTPDLINTNLLPMPGVSKERQQELEPIARAGATAAELAIPVADITKLAAISGKELLGKLTGFNANAKATDFIKGLIGDQSTIKAGFKTDYNNIGKLADKKGYNLLPNSTQKPIEADIFKSELGGLSNDDRTALFNNLNAKKKVLLDRFIDTPSYDNAHKLQSMLGRQGIKFLKNPDKIQTGAEILGLRSSLNNDIQNTFTKYGDTDLAEARQNVTNEYAKNQNKLLLAYKLRSGITKLPGEGIAANAQKIKNAYAKVGLDKELGKPSPPLQTPQSDAAIQDLMKSLSRKSATKWIAGLGLPAGIIGESLRRYL